MEGLNQILPRLVGQLQGSNPKGYNTITNLLKSNGNPDVFVKQILGQMSPESKQKILNQAKNFGCPNDFLSKLQNMR